MLRTALIPALLASAIAMSFGAMGFGAAAQAQTEDPARGLPHALLCTVQDILFVGYLARIEADGSAIYMNPSSGHAMVSPEGVVSHPDGAQGSCAGQTIDELRAAGLTRDFAR